MPAQTPRLISVLLATYNWPEALQLCLNSLREQTDLDFEIIITDDGSGESTRALIEKVQLDFPVPIKHLWQEDIGFRKSLILNQGIAAAQGDYLVFLDGDCIVQNDFIAQHRRLAEPHCLVTGSRILTSEGLKNELVQTKLINQPISDVLRSVWQWRLHNKINKLLPLLLKLPNHPWRYYKKFEWRRIKGCNMACWRSDARAMGGFDESLTGWGHEDADFVFRLQDAGVIRKSGAFATEVFHLWHKMQDRATAEKNAAIVRAKILAKKQV